MKEPQYTDISDIDSLFLTSWQGYCLSSAGFSILNNDQAIPFIPIHNIYLFLHNVGVLFLSLQYPTVAILHRLLQYRLANRFRLIDDEPHTGIHTCVAFSCERVLLPSGLSPSTGSWMKLRSPQSFSYSHLGET